jgi:hypothetical protein
MDIRLISTSKRTARKKIQDEWQEEWKASLKGQHLKRTDDSFPARRAFRIYSPLTRHRTYLTIQMRTGHSWLAPHSRRFRFTDDDRRVCGVIEMVVHVLVDCPRLWEARRELRTQVGGTLGCIASMLGGTPRNEQGRVGNGGIKWKTLNAVLEFAEASGGFKPRAPPVLPRDHDRPQRG